ncbi:MAG TPA: hypothetical protein VFS43_11530 [Polyangiaceae bacterium]|nr:hypothetical protein [Polyangiaceae bacterium]
MPPPTTFRRRAARALVAAALVARPSPAAADEGAAPKVHVLHLAADDRDDRRALPLTKALEGALLRRTNAQFVNTNKALLAMLREARCGQGLAEAALDANRTLDASSGRALDGACLGRVAAAVGAPLGAAQAFAWGWLYRDGAELRVELRLWQRGRPERRASLAVDETAFERTAERLWRHLFEGEGVGDLHVSAEGSRGELYVGGEHQGPFAGAAELTLPAGPATVELLDKGRLVARGAAEIAAGRTQALTLEPARADEPAPCRGAPAAPPPADDGRGARSPWPWVALGVGGLGLAGAGALFLAREGARGDLDETCAGACPPRAQGDIDRSNRYGTLSAVSLGVGVAGVGLGTFLLWRDGQGRGAGAARAGAPPAGLPLAGVREGGPFVGWRGAF